MNVHALQEDPVGELITAFPVPADGGIDLDHNHHRRAKVFKVIRSVLKVTAVSLGTIMLIFLIGGFVFVNILASHLQENILPLAQVNLDSYELEKTSYLYYFDKEGNVRVLQQLHTSTDRRWASYEELPEDLIHAAIAIEDKRFYEHQGVDWITTAKASLNLLLGGNATFGGSTLTQQLIKNLYMTTDETADDVTVQRKVVEIFRAIAFEKVYDKKVVLEWYMNCIYFGDGCNGVKSAAEHYFGKQLQDLTTAECAALIGITNNPSLYNPYRTALDNFRGEQLNGRQRNRRRQESVLGAMYDQGWLTEEEYLAALEEEMVFQSGVDKEEGDESRQVYSWYVDTVLEDVARALAQQDGVSQWNDTIRSHYTTLISRAGYHIYTPYDPQAQLAVDNVYTDLSQIPTTKSSQQLQSGIVIIDNRSGDVVAMAGGVGEKKDFDAYNRADVPLQIGSSIKPLTVYGPAFERGLISPATVVEDMPLTFLSDGTPFPRNDNRTYHYKRTVWRGIVSSVNAVAVNTLSRLGLQSSYDFAREEWGITTLTDHFQTASGVMSDIDYAPLAMGALTQGMTVREVANAYATFANQGVWRQGRTFLLVLDDAGNVVLDNQQESRRILSEKTVNYMNYCLDSAVSVGTGTAADLEAELGMDVAGKTGTTSGNRDRYFAGFTGYYTAAVWCGYDQPEQIVLSGNTANPAARLWKKVMLQLHKGRATIPLYTTAGMEQVSICLDSGKLATDSCYRDVRTADGVNRVEQVWVYKKDKPSGYCDKHIRVDYCVEGHGVANEYCHKFAQIGALKLETKALLKTSQSQINALLKVKDKGLASDYLRNDYIYLIDKYGAATPFYGITGKINQGLQLPYEVCRIHTEQSWQDYQVPPETTAPMVPTQPPTTGTTEPTPPPSTVEPTTQPMPTAETTVPPPTTEATTLPPTTENTEPIPTPTAEPQPTETEPSIDEDIETVR